MEGQRVTVIGLPRKYQNNGKPIPFMKKMPTEKEKVSTYYTAYLSLKLLVILKWFVDTMLLILQSKFLLLMKTMLKSVQRQFPAPG